MQSFKEYLTESGRLFRFDDLPEDGVPKIPNTHEYGFDGGTSGRSDTWGDYPKGSDYTQKSGIFSGQLHEILPYALPRDTKWIKTDVSSGKEKPTLFLDRSDIEKIMKHKTVLTQYKKKQGFERRGSEYFKQSDTSPVPMKQTVYENPLDLISKHHDIVWTDNLNTQKQKLTDAGVAHSAEGF